MGFFAKAAGLETLAAAPAAAPSRLKIPSRAAESKVTLKSVVGLTGAYRSIGILTGIGSGIPLYSWRATERVDRQPSVVRRPDPWMSRRRWQRQYVTNMCVDGNSFLHLHDDPLNSGNAMVPVAATHLNPLATRIGRDRSGKLVYRTIVNRRPTTLSAEEVAHIRLNDFPGFDRGLGPIEACRLALAGAIDTHEYGNTIFDVGATPPGVLTSDQVITPSEAKAAKDQWHEGDSRFIKVTGKGLNFAPIVLKPEDAQWIEAQRFNVLETARMWGIPPVLLAAAIEGSSLTYQNLQDVQQHLAVVTLGPDYIDPLAAEMTDLVPNGQEVRPDYTGVLRRSDKERYQTHKLAIDAGIYDGDHARSVEGIPGPAPKKPAAPASQEDPAA